MNERAEEDKRKDGKEAEEKKKEETRDFDQTTVKDMKMRKRGRRLKKRRGKTSKSVKNVER